MNPRPALLLLLVCGALLGSPAAAQLRYWENPEILVAEGARFPHAAYGGGLVAVAWQEFEADRVWLSLRVTRDLLRWTERRRFAGPFPFRGEQAPIFSLVVDDSARIYIALPTSDRRTTVYVSADGGERFATTVLETPVTTVAPGLALRADGRLLLFVIYDRRDSLVIYHAVLDPGELLSAGTLRSLFRPLTPERALVFSFLPSHAAFQGRDYVAYQSQDSSLGQANSQLWLRVSDRGGEFRDPPILLTDFPEEAEGSERGAQQFDNERPFLLALEDRLAVVWERRLPARPKQIYYMELGPDGKPIVRAGAKNPYRRITETDSESLAPQLFRLRDTLYAMWFDSRRGQHHVFVAEKDGELWREREIAPALAGASIYPCFVEAAGRVAVLWENQQGGRSRLALGGPDLSVEPPHISTQGFTVGMPSRESRVSFTWTAPSDPAGISGFSWSWSRDPNVVPERRLMLPADRRSVTVSANADGTWYFRVSAQDFAGNWSVPATAIYERDTTPPPPVIFDPLPLDQIGYVATNSPRISWRPGSSEPVSGYAYELERIDADPSAAPESAASLRPAALAPDSARVRTQATFRQYDNLDNGLWVFSVAAIDLAGNVGQPGRLVMRLNKYVPVTLVTSVEGTRDAAGRVSLAIRGRGFAEDGTVEEVFLDRDGKPPYDYSFPRGSFRVAGDRLIDSLALVRYEEGTYRVGVVHSKRGLTLTEPLLKLEAPGTVKLGDFGAASYVPPWKPSERPRFRVSTSALLSWALVAFLAVAFVGSASRLIAVAREASSLREQVLAVVRGGGLEKEELMRVLKSRGMSLRVKFTLLIVVLVILIVLMLAVPLSISMVDTQTRNLAEGLQQRTRVLLSSIATAAGRFLIDQDAASLLSLTNQIVAMPEAEYVTITGITPRGSDRPGAGEEYVWATNDPEIAAKIGGGEFEAGRSVLRDEASPSVPALAERINTTAMSQIGTLVQELDRLLAEARPLYGRTDLASVARVEELGRQQTALRARIDRELGAIGGEVASVPEFDSERLQRRYLFYQPIVFRIPGSDIVFRGLVRISVSAVPILEEIGQTRARLYRTIGLIALGAVALGALGALILASITIGPIRRLAEGVARIRDTEDKEQLKDHRIEIRQRDEIRMLADTINEMTQGLVKAAIASKELTVGKEIQKMFLPLAADASGAKGTTGHESNEALEIFGYYEGAKGVSGDYFDYRRVDADHYAVIKCDVAGKGVPAALIMIEVATIFQTYFKSWSLQNQGLHIERFVYAVNDMLEERGFKGRFATLMVALVNIRTGACVMVNAGDNIVHIYSARERRMLTKQHPNPPAAGVFPSALLEAQSGFKPVTERLEPGDTLFLFTDGIEEAQRLFRDRSFAPIELQQDEEFEDDGEVVAFPKGSHFEQFGIRRIHRIVSAVFNRRSYELRKVHDPTPDERYVFDFSGGRGGVDEAVLALVAVEKVFRLYLDPSAGPNDIVLVDRKVDAYLQEHFAQYSLYFRHPAERAADATHAAYSHLREDAQYDDLTILAIRRK